MPFDARAIDHWIFDLDNTLYHPRHDLFGLIDARMRGFIGRLLGVGEDEAHRVQKRYFHDHGTTLAGLMANHGVDAHDFLADVHAIPLDRLPPAPALGDLIGALPGTKYIFTNGDAPYARRVLDRLGIGAQFAAVHDIHAMGLVPKPDPAAYAGLLAAHGIEPARAVFVEDMARNLIPAKALGMATIWVDNGSEWGNGGADMGAIDLVIDDLDRWLAGVVGTLTQDREDER